MAADRPLSSGPPSRPGGTPVGVWPSAVWIAVGTLFYLSNPDRFAGWKGAIYYVFGTGVIALVGGAVGFAAHRTVSRILDRLLDEVFHKRDLTTQLLSLAVRLLVYGAEGFAVGFLAAVVLDLLG